MIKLHKWYVYSHKSFRGCVWAVDEEQSLKAARKAFGYVYITVSRR